jgi:hypothetical protein
MAGTFKNNIITHPWLKGPLTADGAVSALRTLGRKVTALPPRHFVPLNEALALVKSRLGSYSLAAHDLTRRAGAGEFTIGARMIRPDGSEEVFLLRRAAWQWHVIRDHGRPGSELFARVHGPIFSSGSGWHFFVGRRRLDRVYSTAAPSRSSEKPHSSATPVASAATSASSEWDQCTDWSVEKVFRELKLRGREPLRVVVKTLPKIYPDIPGALDRLVAEKPWMTAQLRNAIWAALEKEAGKKLRKGEVPSWDTCKDLLRAWHAWRHR